MQGTSFCRSCKQSSGNYINPNCAVLCRHSAIITTTPSTTHPCLALPCLSQTLSFHITSPKPFVLPSLSPAPHPKCNPTAHQPLFSVCPQGVTLQGTAAVGAERCTWQQRLLLLLLLLAVKCHKA